MPGKPRILVFDSGMGGLSVAAALHRCVPDADLCYAADTAAFPYGAWDEPRLIERICTVVGALIDKVDPQTVVVACNTASTLALRELRKRFKVAFVGTVPAIKPAASQTRSGMIGVLATPGTVSREYTRALVDTYAFHCDVILHGCEGLADLAEQKLRGGAVALGAISREIEPVFVEKAGKRTDVVVLGCTHYPLLLEELQKAAPWPCIFIDPSEAIARRAQDILPDALPPQSNIPGNIAFVSSAQGLECAAAFSRFGFTSTEVIDLPIATDV